MIFFAGLAAGAAMGFCICRFAYILECRKNRVVCNETEKEKELCRQLERLISYGNNV